MPAKTDATAVDEQRTLAHLRELIEALDRRVPHIESAGEIQIAHDAAAVRDKALERIAEIEQRVKAGR